MNKRLISGLLIASLISTQLPVMTLATNVLPENEITEETSTVQPENEMTEETNIVSEKTTTVEPIGEGGIVENTESLENNLENDSSEAVIPEQTEDYSEGEIVAQEAGTAEENLIPYVVEGGNIYFDPSTGTIVRADEIVTDESLTNVIIPESINGIPVTTIGEKAFSKCFSLKEIIIPNSVTTIGERAFERCYSLKSIVIPDSVTTIGESAFFACSLESIIIPNSVTTIGGGVFSACGSLKEISIPNSVTTIEEGAFSVCSSLKEISIPNSVTTIGEGAFSACNGLKEIIIPNSVTIIGERAFEKCYSLESIVISNSVTTIENHAFGQCYSLESIVIPDSVTTIRDAAFEDCGLENIYYAGSKEEWEQMYISENNDSLKSATIHYNSTGPDQTYTIKIGVYDGWDMLTDTIYVDGVAYPIEESQYEMKGDKNTEFTKKKVVLYLNDGKIVNIKLLETAIAEGTLNNHTRKTGIYTAWDVFTNTIYVDDIAYTIDESQYEIKDDFINKSVAIYLNSANKVVYIEVLDNTIVKPVKEYTTKTGLCTGGSEFTNEIYIDNKAYLIDDNYKIDDAYISSLLNKRVYFLIKGEKISHINTLENGGFVKPSLEGDYTGHLTYDKRLFRKDIPDIDLKIKVTNKKIRPQDLQKEYDIEIIYADPYFQNVTFDLKELIWKIDDHFHLKEVKDSVENVKLGIGETWSTEAIIEANEGYIPDDVTTTLNHSLEVTTKQGPSSKVKLTTTITNIILEKEEKLKEKEKEKERKKYGVSKEVAKEINKMDFNLNSQVTLPPRLTNDILGRDKDQMARLQKLISMCVMTATEDPKMETSEIKALEKELGEKLSNKTIEAAENAIKQQLSSEFGEVRFITEEMLTDATIEKFLKSCKIHKSIRVKLKDKDGKKLILKVNYDGHDFTFNDKNSGNFGQITYEIIDTSNKAKRKIYEDYSKYDRGTVSKSDMETFTKEAYGLMKDSLKEVFMTISGDVINEVAGQVLGKVTQKLIKKHIGSVADGLFDLTIGLVEAKPDQYKVTQTRTKCPVDIYVYDAKGNLCGSIVDNQVVNSNNDVCMYVDNEEKCIYYLGNDYTVKYVGTGDGTMTHTISEYDEDTNELERELVFNNVPLTKDIVYTSFIPAEFNRDKETYNLVQENGTVVVADTDTYVPEINEDPIPEDTTPTETKKGSSTVSNAYPRNDIEVTSSTGGTITPNTKHTTKGTAVSLTVKLDDGYTLDTITVTDKDGNKIEVTQKDTNLYQFTMPDCNVEVSATFKEVTKETPTQQQTTNATTLPFTDVADNAWYRDAVAYVYQKGMMQGDGSETTFNPQGNTTGGMIVTILHRLEGTPKVSTVASTGQWFSDAVNWAIENQIVEATFMPKEVITREQLANVFYCYMQYKDEDTTQRADLSHFIDSNQLSGTTQEAMQWANATGLLNGMTDTTLDPKGSTTRAQLATILTRFTK